MRSAPLPLSGYPFAHTRDPEEAVALYARLNTPVRIELSGRDLAFEWRANAVSLGPLTISAHAFGDTFCAGTEAVEDVFGLAIPIGNACAEGRQNDQAIAMVAGQSAWLASPGHASTARLEAGYRSIHISAPREDMETTLAVLCGLMPREPLQFQPQFSLTSPAGAALLRLVRFAMEEADHEPSAFVSPLVASRIGEAILFQLLLAQPHNHSGLLGARARAAEPAHVRQVAEYLEANLARPIRMTDLTRLTGASARAIQTGFQKHHGCSPLRFLKTRRLVHARAKLLSNADVTVTQVALACGFEHLGRFSFQYRVQFGESPIETLGKRIRFRSGPKLAP